MISQPTQPRPVALTAAAWATLAAGLAAWMWLGDWRWAGTGLLVFLVLAAVAGRRNR